MKTLTPSKLPAGLAVLALISLLGIALQIRSVPGMRGDRYPSAMEVGQMLAIPAILAVAAIGVARTPRSQALMAIVAVFGAYCVFFSMSFGLMLWIAFALLLWSALLNWTG